ncbi:zinc ribbon domain-containing protein [Chloroflexota bacterium]
MIYIRPKKSEVIELATRMGNTYIGSTAKLATNSQYKCVRCNKPRPENDRFCAFCGESQFERVGYYCSNCGKDIDEEWKVCANCGKLLNKGD